MTAGYTSSSGEFNKAEVAETWIWQLNTNKVVGVSACNLDYSRYYDNMTNVALICINARTPWHPKQRPGRDYHLSQTHFHSPPECVIHILQLPPHGCCCK